MQSKKILVVDDEALLVDSLSVALSAEGYRVASAHDGGEALAALRRDRPDLVLLDWMLPGIDGLEVCRVIRREVGTPVIMLTARDAEIDKVIGLEMGADDYITKPFSLRELLARVRAVMRRAAGPAGCAGGEGPLRFGALTVDLKARRVMVEEKAVELRPKEFQLLEALVAQPDTALSREALIERVWGENFMGEEKTLEVHVRWLRQKIEPEPSRPRYLLTVRGVGYRWAMQPSYVP